METKKISPLDLEEKRKIMRHYIFDEKEVHQIKNFTQLKIDENTFGYGILLPREKEITNKMGEVVNKEQIWSPVIITNKREMIEATKEMEINYKIKFEAIPTQLKLRWSLDSIKSFLEDDDLIPDESPKEIIERIYNKSKQISSFIEERWYKVNALRDPATYVFSLFDSFPIKEERGLSGTGKTKEMKRSKNISFNATDIMVNPSESTLFRETNDKRPTKYIDEAEKLFVVKKGNIESDSRVELINGSYSKGSSIPRVEKIGNKFVVCYYQVYSPTTIGSINGIYGATEGRAITQIHTRSHDNDPRGEIEVNDNDPEWIIIRNSLYLFGLRYWKQIENIYRDDSLFKNLKLKKRDLQIWKPILTIAKLVSDDWFKEISDFAIELSEMRLDDLIPESSFDYMCLDALKRTIEIYPETDKHYLDRIKETYCINKSDEQKANIYLNRNIGQHLKKLGFVKKRDGAGTYIIANKNIFDDIISPICPQLAFLSTLSTLSTHLKVNHTKSSVDDVKIDEDKKKEFVKIVKIDEDKKNESVDKNTPFYEENVDSVDKNINYKGGGSK